MNKKLRFLIKYYFEKRVKNRRLKENSYINRLISSIVDCLLVLMPSESVILLMSSGPCRLELLFSYNMIDVTNITEIEIKAIVTFPSNSNYRHFLTPSTLYEFANILSRFYN